MSDLFRQFPNAYALLLPLAAGVFACGAAVSLSRMGLPTGRVLVYLAATVLAALVGGRALYLVEHGIRFSDEMFWRGLAGWTGFSLYGGLLAAGLVGGLLAQRLGWPTWRMADRVTPWVAVSIALAKTGCFVKGCCGGTVSSLPWAVTYPWGSPSHVMQISHDGFRALTGPLPVHPVQLYEAALSIALAALLTMYFRRTTRRTAMDGELAFAFLILFTVGRWLLLPLRAADTWLQPWLYATLISALAVLWAIRTTRSSYARQSVEFPTVWRR